MKQSCRIIIKLLFLLGVDVEANGLETRPWGRVAGAKSGSIHEGRQCGRMLSKAGLQGGAVGGLGWCTGDVGERLGRTIQPCFLMKPSQGDCLCAWTPLLFQVKDGEAAALTLMEEQLPLGLFGPSASPLLWGPASRPFLLCIFFSPLSPRMLSCETIKHRCPQLK